MIFFSKNFNVLNLEIPLSLIIIIFTVLGLIVFLIILFLFFSKKNKKTVYKNEVIDIKKLKSINDFESLRDDFEIELGKIKKIIRNTQ